MIQLIKNLFRPKDELVGEWTTTEEGGVHQLGGSRLRLLGNGKGTLESWGLGEDDPFEYTDQIEWKRVGRETIKIKESKDSEFDLVRYKIELYQGPYGALYDMLYDPEFELVNSDKRGIWTIPGELFKRK